MDKILSNVGNFGQILISRTIEGFGKKVLNLIGPVHPPMSHVARIIFIVQLFE